MLKGLRFKIQEAFYTWYLHRIDVGGSADFRISGGGSATKAGLDEYVTIKNGGNVGIGTTDPDDQLHVFSSTNNEGITIQTGDNANDQGIGFQNSGTFLYMAYLYRTDAGANMADLRFSNGIGSYLR